MSTWRHGYRTRGAVKQPLRRASREDPADCAAPVGAHHDHAGPFSLGDLGEPAGRRARGHGPKLGRHVSHLFPRRLEHGGGDLRCSLAVPFPPTGRGEIRLRRLIKEALRMRPSRIIVGEVRREECRDLLIALNSGIASLTQTPCGQEARQPKARVVSGPRRCSHTDEGLGTPTPEVEAPCVPSCPTRSTASPSSSWRSSPRWSVAASPVCLSRRRSVDGRRSGDQATTPALSPGGMGPGLSGLLRRPAASVPPGFPSGGLLRLSRLAWPSSGAPPQQPERHCTGRQPRHIPPQWHDGSVAAVSRVRAVTERGATAERQALRITNWEQCACQGDLDIIPHSRAGSIMDNKSKTAGRKRDGPVAPGAVFDRPLNRSDESRGPQLMRVGQLPENNEDPRASTSPPPSSLRVFIIALPLWGRCPKRQ
jgi:Type II/IV secretion system protein